jgi:hypothetical protein
MSIVDFAELYPRLYPVIALRPHGKLGDWWIFKSYKAGFKIPNVDYPRNPNRFRQGGHPGLIIERLHYPYNMRTPIQQAWRGVFADGVANWQGFNDFTKQFYNLPAKYEYYTGFNHYLTMYLRANYPPVVGGAYLLLEDGGKIQTEAGEFLIQE